MNPTASVPPSTPTGSTLRCASGRLAVLGGVVLLLSAGLLLPIPLHGRFWNEFFNLAHAPAFFVFSLVIAGVLDPGSIGLSKTHTVLLPMTLSRAALLSAVVTGLGAGGEILQRLSHRSASLGDALANALGALAALLWILSSRCAAMNRGALRAGAVLLLVCGVWNPLAELNDLRLQQQEFPILSSLERSREIALWRPIESSATRSSSWSAEGEWSLQIVTRPAPYSGAALIWPVADWSSFSHLQFDLLNASSRQLEIDVKIADGRHAASGFAPDDRFLQSIQIGPRSQQNVSISMEQIRDGPADRRMDLTDIRTVELYIVDCNSNVEFFVDNIRLRSN